MRSRLTSAAAAILMGSLGMLASAAGMTPLAAPASSGEILRELQRFRETGRVLYLAAHPDDENTRLISYLANGRHYATGYLSITRGDGGQNLIGSELRDLLGVIRTQELLAARRIDGGRQFFTRANDFGFSKSYEEALGVWDRAQVLTDTVRVIRTFRPHVIVTRFSPIPGGTHGHHTASAVLAVEAFKLAGDPEAMKEELGDLPPWQPTRVVWNAGRFFGNIEGPLLELDAGGYDALRGESFGEIAARSRSQHSSQGFGSVGTRGPAREVFQPLAGEPATQDLMDGVALGWDQFTGGAAIATYIDDVIENFEPTSPSSSIPGLLRIREALATAEGDATILAEKRVQLDGIIVAALGLYAEANVDSAAVVPGEAIKVRHSVILRGVPPALVRWTGIRYLATGETTELDLALAVNEPQRVEATEVLPATLPLTHPYWLEQPGTPGMFRVDDPSLIGTPENAPVNAMVYSLAIGPHEIDVPVTPVEVIDDPVRGEIRQPMQVIPPVSVAFAGELELFKPGETKDVRVTATAARADANGTLRLALPAGWTASPAGVPFSLASVGATTTASFAVTAPAAPETALIGVAAEIGRRRFDRTRQEIVYDHIPRQLLQPRAQLAAVCLDVQIRGGTVGYLPGAGDSTAEALSRLGYTVKVLSEADLTAGGLAGLDAVVLGIRAYNTRKDLMTKLPALWDYVRAGGNVIAQYNTTADLPRGDLGPYPLKISRDRVTDENAKVTFLDPTHPVMTGPNRLTPADFDGWVQERGLYFPDQWDDAYTPLLGMADAGEEMTKGSLLVAPLGKGHFVYTGLSLFRELPAGVPGAYRLLANLVSLQSEEGK